MDLESEQATSEVAPRRPLSGAVSVERTIGRHVLRIETGVLAKQAHGAVFVTYRDSAVLVTAATDKPWRELDFFPLTVDYRERTAAAGKFPGGFIKREGRPSQKETLTCRCIDRPIRPLFPEGFKDEVQVLCSVLSADPDYDSDTLAMIGAFAALHISKIPFMGPGAAMRIGRTDGEWILMPTDEERAQGDVDLIVAGTMDAVAMVECGAKEASEDDCVDAIMTAHAAIRTIAEAIDELREKVGVPKIEVAAPVVDERTFEDLKGKYWDTLRETLLTPGKHVKSEALKQLRKQVIDEATQGMAEDDPERPAREKAVKSAFGRLTSSRIRRMVLDDEQRIDSRGLKDIRPISIQLGILPRTHGSALFTRGETQSLTTVTLGTQMDAQKVDGLREPYSKTFYLDYNFPPFSVGEVKPMRGPGRREIGHGMLAERALASMLPPAEEFPYTIRIISDILESNGSSSMATVCAGSLAMMDAGVLLRKPVAGIAMGLIAEGEKVKVLSDILGSEDHDGDMDFKVTGTADGITALQMDIKIAGLPVDVLRRALLQAREGRLHILERMAEAISSPRPNMSPHAPRILRTMIPVDKIGALIGPGGKNIRMIQERTGTNVEVDDTGAVVISGRNEAGLHEAVLFVESYTKEVQLGEKYKGTVTDVRDFGAFVELYPGQEALCHVSELADEYVENVTDVVNVGDSLEVTVINVDPSGKVKVSARTNPSPDSGPRGDRPRGDRDRGSRGPRGPREGSRPGGSGPRRDGPRPPGRGPRPHASRDSERPRDSRPPESNDAAGGSDREDSGDEAARRRRRRRR